MTTSWEETNGRFGAVLGPASGLDEDAWLDALGALGRLSERQRVAVSLRYLEDLPYAEIAGITGWPQKG